MIGVHKASLEALASYGRHSVDETRRNLLAAVQRLVDSVPLVVPNGTRLTVSAVCKEAGVDRATLYRFHTPVLTEIRRRKDASPQSRLKESRAELTGTEARLKEYRTLIEEAQAEVAALARVNYRLDARNKELEVLLRSRDNVISELQQQLNRTSSKIVRNIKNVARD